MICIGIVADRHICCRLSGTLVHFVCGCVQLVVGVMVVVDVVLVVMVMVMVHIRHHNHIHWLVVDNTVMYNMMNMDRIIDAFGGCCVFLGQVRLWFHYHSMRMNHMDWLEELHWWPMVHCGTRFLWLKWSKWWKWFVGNWLIAEMNKKRKKERTISIKNNWFGIYKIHLF